MWKMFMTSWVRIVLLFNLVLVSTVFEAAQDSSEYIDTYDVKLFTNGRSIETTLTRTGHRKRITLIIRTFETSFTLDLFLNTNLFAKDYIERSISVWGVTYHQCNHSSSHCFYTGSVRNEPQSSAAVSTCQGIVGSFMVGNESYHISPVNASSRRQHRIHRGMNDSLSRWMCGAKNLSRVRTNIKVKRSLPYPQNLDRDVDVIELYLAVDYDEYKHYNSSLSQVYSRAKNVANIVSALYQILDIYVILVGVEVWQNSTLMAISADSSSTLGNWYAYRRTSINPFHYNDNAFLITRASYESSIVGKANVGTMCSFMSSGGIVSDISPNTGVVGAILTHEIGHNFGLIHDTGSCVCDDPSGTCIMYPQTMVSNPATKFSSCSKNMLATAKSQGIDACLKNMPQTVFQNSPVCGNGIVDEGEQCDCGRAPFKECNNTCCNSTTCQLIGSAGCAGGKCCDVARCRLQPLGYTCRSVDDDCDLPEYCSGTSAMCPEDVYKHDGTNCSISDVPSFCYGGLCRNHQSQCQLLWGTSVNNAAQSCYTRLNTNGQHQGNCGVTGWNSSGVTGFIPCADKNVLCGKLQCDNINAQLSHYSTFYLQSTATLGGTQCMSIIFDFGQQVTDPGLVPNGAPCGNGSMCLSQKCVPTSDVLSQKSCTSCYNGGICNNMGHCHCPAGYGPPDCIRSGPGGSLDSGPMSSGTSSTSKTTMATNTCMIVKAYGMNSNGGSNAASNIDESQCVNLCLNSLNCKSLDYNIVERSCYTHEDTSGAQPSTTCNRYTVCPSYELSQPSACANQFLAFANTSPNLQYSSYQSTQSLSDCENSCLQRNCTNFVYRPSQQGCYLFNNGLYVTSYVNGSTMYVRQWCVSTPIPTILPALSTTTSATTSTSTMALSSTTTSTTTTTTTTTSTTTPPTSTTTIPTSTSSTTTPTTTTTTSSTTTTTTTTKPTSKTTNAASTTTPATTTTTTTKPPTTTTYNMIFPNTQPTLPETTTLPMTACQLVKAYGMNSNGGFSIASNVDEIQCRDLCLNNASCASVDYNMIDRSCHIHGDTTGAQPSKCCNRYTVCSLSNASPSSVCTNQFLIFQNTSPTLEQSFIQMTLTLTSCQFFCLQLDCMNFVYLPLQQSCYLFNSATYTLNTMNGATMYVRQWCMPMPQLATFQTTPKVCTLGVGLTGDWSGPSNPLIMNSVYANRQNSWSADTNQCLSTLDSSFYFLEVCAGLKPNTTAQVQTSGAFPSPIGFDWLSTSQTGVDTGCRGGVVIMTNGVTIKLVQLGGGVYSATRQTSWSLFSITNSMGNTSGLFSAYGSTPYNGYQALKFSNPLVTPTTSQFNVATNKYQCIQGGVFFFSFSVGVPGGQPSQVQLDGLSYTFLADRQTTNNNGVTTLSRNVLTPCSSSTSVRMVNNIGSVTPGSGTNLISFTAFPYSVKSGTSVAWAGYRTSSTSATSYPLTFDLWLVNLNVNPSNNALITIPIQGYYYVYISAGVQASSMLSMSVTKNNQTIFSLTRQATNHNGIDTIGHGMVMLLNQNDVVNVVLDPNSGLYSSTWGLHASFFGMLLYPGS